MTARTCNRRNILL